MTARDHRQPDLVRGLGLFEATAANMLDMIGVGPFITIPLLLGAMGGPQAMIGWVLGALIAVCDGLVWAELGAAMPGSGGPYHYLQEAFGPNGLGRMMSFLFIWETIFIAPLSIASGAVGFSQYLKYLWPVIGPWEAKLVSAAVCLLVTALLYRDVRSVGRLCVAMWAVVMFTGAWIVVSGLSNFQVQRILDFPPGAFSLTPGFFAGLGGATLIAMYDYGGYFNVCLFGGEVKRPERTIPRSILLAILIVAFFYLTMNLTIIGVVPWREAVHSTSIVSDFMQKLYGAATARVMTVLILWTTFASVFALMLGYSRVPFAAAAQGRFFRPFARLHPTKRFPSFSLVTIGVFSALACWFDLEALVKGLIVIQIMIQFMAQVVAVTLIRRFRPDIKRPFQMWFYPVTSVVAFAGWGYILIVSGWNYILAGTGLLVFGILAYLWRASRSSEWPFGNDAANRGVSLP